MTGPRRIAVDASVAIKWVVEEPDSRQARALLSAAAVGSIGLLAPEFLMVEAANVLNTRSRPGRDFTIAEARSAFADLNRLLSQLVPDRLLLDPAREIAFSYGVSVYDALYVALAAREGAELVTADRRLAAAVPLDIARVTLLIDFDA